MFFLQKIACILLMSSVVSYANANLKKVTLQLSWFDQFQFAGYYIAKEKGFYADAGLDVEIIPFKFGLDIPEDVSSGKIDFATGDQNLIIEKAKGQKIVALYALLQSSPLVLLSTKESNITNVHDFVGKKIMTTVKETHEASLTAMVKSQGVSPSDYTFLKHTHDINDLVNKKTDVISAYTSKSPFALKQMGIEFTVFNPNDYGFDMYSDFLFTNEEFIAKDLKTAHAFKEASLKGWSYAYNNIQESVDLIIQKYNQQKLSKEELIYEAEELKKLSFDNTLELGKIDKNKMQRIYDLYNLMGLIENKINMNDFIINNSFSLSQEEKNYLANKKELLYCADPNWMPLEGIKDGKIIGMSGDYLQEIQTKIAIPLKLLLTSSWQESLEYAKMRKCDMFLLAMETPERKTYMNFTTPYLSIPLVIATTNDKFFISDIKEVLDKKVALIKGYSSSELLRLKYPKNNFVEVQNIQEGLRKVASGELFGLIDTVVTIGYETQKNYMGTLKISGQIGSNWELGIASRNDEPQLATILEKVVNSIDDKTKQKILSDWVSVTYEKGFDYSLFWKLLAGLVILLAVIALRLRAIQNYNKKINKNLKIIDQYVLLTHTDTRGVITYASEALCKLSGYTKKELIGKPQNIFRHPDVDKKIFEDMWKTIKSGKSWRGEIKNLKKDKSSYWVEASISPIFDKHGKISGYSGFRNDITDKKRIETLSITDQLTKISNRLFLDNNYKLEIQRAKRYKNVFSVIMIDVDFFKAINDTFGHAVGDKVLIAVANILKENIRNTDLLGRWGGEEFLIICPQTTSSEAAVLAEKLRIKIENFNFDTVGRKTCSFGISEYILDNQNDDVISRADKALYKAKDNGRNTIVVM